MRKTILLFLTTLFLSTLFHLNVFGFNNHYAIIPDYSTQVDTCGGNFISLSINNITCNDDGTYNMVSFIHTSDTASLIDVYINDTLEGQFSLQEFYTFENIPQRPDFEKDVLTICIIDYPDCCSTLYYEQPNCVNNTCEIDEVEIEYECVGDSLYYAFISISANNSSGLFDVSSRYFDFLGTFDIEKQPFEIGPLRSEVLFDLKIRDSQLGCELDTTLVFNDCILNPCDLEFINTDTIICNADGSYNVTFAYGAIDMAGELIEVFVNGDFIREFINEGTVSLENIESLDGNDFDHVEICISNINCCLEVEYPQPNCVVDPSLCEIDVVAVDSTFCNGDGTFGLRARYNLEHQNSDLVDVYINDAFFDSFLINYSQSVWVDDIPFVDSIESNITICVQGNPDCCSSLDFMEPDCDQVIEPTCLVENVNVFNTQCTGDNQYSMSIDFDLIGNLNAPITVYLNGAPKDNISVDNLPLELNDLIPNDSVDVEIITICLDELEDECCFGFTFDRPACLTSSIDESFADGIVLSPNPTTDIVNINHIPDDIIGLNILDNLGRSFLQVKASSEMQFDISNYVEGLYIIQFFTSDNRVVHKKFVKSR